MAKAYSIDLRERVLNYLDHHTKQAASEVFSVDLRTVYRWSKLKRETGSVRPKKRQFAYRKMDYDALEQYVKAHPDEYLSEIAAHFSVTLQAVFYALKTLKITRKKRQRCTKKAMKRQDRLSREL